MTAFRRSLCALGLLGAALALSGCSGVRGIAISEACRYAAQHDLICADFGIRSLDAGTLAGVPLTGSRGAALADDRSVVTAWDRGSLPLAFTVTLDVSNPDDAPLTIEQLAWTLTADGTEVARGVSTETRTVTPGATAVSPTPRLDRPP